MIVSIIDTVEGRSMDKKRIAEQIQEAAERLDVQSEELDNVTDSWVSGKITTDVLKEAIIREFLENIDMSLEVGVDVDCCCDRFFDRKLDEGFKDDEEIHEYLRNDCSELVGPMLDEFSEGFSILHIMEELGMHDTATGFATDIMNTIDRDVAGGKYLYRYVDICLKAVSDRIKESLSKGSPTAWMSCRRTIDGQVG